MQVLVPPKQRKRNMSCRQSSSCEMPWKSNTTPSGGGIAIEWRQSFIPQIFKVPSSSYMMQKKNTNSDQRYERKEKQKTPSVCSESGKRGPKTGNSIWAQVKVDGHVLQGNNATEHQNHFFPSKPIQSVV
ncbi:hypothetical protein J3459_017171 [Metarhizium acridum]|nr:hypothetical protein J3459_017171 [Metarhizium acridum]